jgi:uncharacterized small protein (DUF1192 family)
MRNFRVFKAETIIGVLKKAMTINAFADEGNEGANTNPAPTINYEQLIAQARKEEKDKLYPKIKSLEDEKANLIKIGNDNLIRIGELTQENERLTAELKSLKDNGEDTQQVKDLQTQIATLTAENEKLKKETHSEDELRKQIEQEYEVKLYLKEQVDANKDSILSSFISKVQGKTKEEVDASIKAVKEESLTIKKELGLVDEQGNPIETGKKTDTKKDPKDSGSNQQTNSQKSNKAPASNPTEGTGVESFDPDYLRNLDPASSEYAEFRKKLGLK